MSFIHHNSHECCKSELDLFEVPATQTSVESGAFVEYNPISSLSDNSCPIEFCVSGSGTDYIDLANTQLLIKCKITKANGNNLVPADDHVAPINNLLHSLFSEVDVKLNDTLVSTTNNTYAYRAYLENLLTFDGPTKQTQLMAALFYKDVAGGMQDANPHEVAATNTGMKKRNSFMESSAVVDLVGQIHSDLFFQDRLLLNDVTMRLRLVRNKDAFVLMSSVVNAAYKLKIIEAKLLVRKVKILPSVQVAIAKALESSTAKYPIKTIITKSYTIPRGALSHTQENVFSGQLPSRLVIGIVNNDSYNGSYASNPLDFQHKDLTSVKVFMDGQGQLVRPIEVDFAADQYMQGYISIFAGTGKLFRDESCDITRSDYKSGYALFCFDLSPDLSGPCDHFQLSREGALRLDLTFGTALDATVNVIVLSEFDSLVEIDRNRSVLFDYSS